MNFAARLCTKLLLYICPTLLAIEYIVSIVLYYYLFTGRNYD